MLAHPAATRAQAVAALAGACAFWGLGFPLMKVLMMGAEQADPRMSSWFVAAFLVGARFVIAAALLTLVRPVRPSTTELAQGVGLGLVTGVGMILQADGLHYTAASTSAFLTQGYVVLLPVAATVMSQRAPPVRIILCALLVLAGLAVLARFDPRSLSLGRGERETLGAAACFALQILLLDARRFLNNRVAPVTNVMFIVIALVMLPPLIVTGRHVADMGTVFTMPMSVTYFVVTVLLPTIGSFLLMNRYQRLVTASEAGIVYAMEPVFASAFALVVPGVLSALSGIAYPNEVVDLRLLVGGTLVVSANVLLAALKGLS